MYFDAVLNERMIPLFNGTPEETKKWLQEEASPHVDDQCWVCIGVTMETIRPSEYLKR